MKAPKTDRWKAARDGTCKKVIGKEELMNREERKGVIWKERKVESEIEIQGRFGTSGRLFCAKKK